MLELDNLSDLLYYPYRLHPFLLSQGLSIDLVSTTRLPCGKT